MGPDDMFDDGPGGAGGGNWFQNALDWLGGALNTAGEFINTATSALDGIDPGSVPTNPGSGGATPVTTAGIFGLTTGGLLIAAGLGFLVYKLAK
jgi:hypothetical protein